MLCALASVVVSVVTLSTPSALAVTVAAGCAPTEVAIDELVGHEMVDAADIGLTIGPIGGDAAVRIFREEGSSSWVLINSAVSQTAGDAQLRFGLFVAGFMRGATIDHRTTTSETVVRSGLLDGLDFDAVEIRAGRFNISVAVAAPAGTSPEDPQATRLIQLARQQANLIPDSCQEQPESQGHDSAVIAGRILGLTIFWGSAAAGIWLLVKKSKRH